MLVSGIRYTISSQLITQYRLSLMTVVIQSLASKHSIDATLTIKPAYSGNDELELIGYTLELITLKEHVNYTCTTANVTSKHIQRIMRDSKEDLLNIFVKSCTDTFFKYAGLHSYR